MKLAIFEAGEAPEAIRSRHPNYANMCAQMLQQVGLDFTYARYRVYDDTCQWPSLRDYDAAIITGSPDSAYDDYKWITKLSHYINDMASLNIPQIGLCFGHQIIAQALGGKVEAASKGWGIGRHCYQLYLPFDLKADTPYQKNDIKLAVSHKDQVTKTPDDTFVWASSAFTSNAGLLFQESPILTCQGHPEFNDSFMTDLYEARRGTTLNSDEVDDALKSLEQPADDTYLATMIASFIKRNIT